MPPKALAHKRRASIRRRSSPWSLGTRHKHSRTREKKCMRTPASCGVPANGRHRDRSPFIDTKIQTLTPTEVSKKGGILLANPLQSSSSTFSWGSFLGFFAFKEGMWDTQIAALGGWPTVSGGFFYCPDEVIDLRDRGQIMLEGGQIMRKVTDQRRRTIRTGPAGSDKPLYVNLNTAAGTEALEDARAGMRAGLRTGWVPLVSTRKTVLLVSPNPANTLSLFRVFGDASFAG